MKDTEAKKAMQKMISLYGAHATILALADALRELGPEWQGDGGPATGVEAVTGYAPWNEADWRTSVPQH